MQGGVKPIPITSWILMALALLGGLNHPVRAQTGTLAPASPHEWEVAKPARLKANSYWQEKLGDPTDDSSLVAVTGTSPDPRLLDRLSGLTDATRGSLLLDTDTQSFSGLLPSRCLKILQAWGFILEFPASEAPLGPKSVPVNDDCENALVINAGDTVTGSTVEAADHDVWYAFTPVTTDTYSLSTAGSGFDTILRVYSDCGGTQLAYDDDGGPGSTSALEIDLVAGVTYRIQISGYWSSSAGNYTFTVSTGSTGPTSPIPNDECTTATPITADNTVQGNTTGATNANVWYTFTAPESSLYAISTTGSSFDTLLYLYESCTSGYIAYDDDGGDGRTSLITRELEAGQTVLICVDGYGNATGHYQLTVTPMVVMSGDLCSHAIALPDAGRYTDTLVDRVYHELWYSYTPKTSGPVVIDLAGSDFDTVLSVWNQCDGDVMVYNDDSGVNNTSRLCMEMTADVTYDLCIGGYWGDTGNTVLTVTPVSSPSNDSSQAAIPVSLNQPYTGTTDGATCSVYGTTSSDLDLMDVWYSFTPAQSGYFKISADSNQFDPTLAVYDVPQHVERASNDDECDLNPAVTLSLSAGQTYLMRVAGYKLSTGAYTLRIERQAPVALVQPFGPTPPHQATMVSPQTLLCWNGTGAALTSQAVTVKRLSSSRRQHPKAIYGLDDRLDEYQVQDADLLNLGASTAVLVDRSSLQDNGDGTYTLPSETLTEYITNVYDYPLNPDMAHAEQPNPGWCSGFLVDRDILATAGHCAECGDDINDIAVVFDFVMQDAHTATLVVPQDDVYFVTDIVAVQNGEPDWGLLQLDRPVTGRRPLPVRRQGVISEKESLVMIGHPLGLPRKYDLGATVRDNWRPGSFSANLDAFGGNSGSAVINAQTGEVEGILVRGYSDFTVVDGQIQYAVYPDNGAYGEDSTRSTAFSGLLPTYQVYLGTQPDSLSLVGVDLRQMQYQPPDLADHTPYYWQVVTTLGDQQSIGPIWRFQTQ